jgi:hypothetical protein
MHLADCSNLKMMIRSCVRTLLPTIGLLVFVVVVIFDAISARLMPKGL